MLWFLLPRFLIWRLSLVMVSAEVDVGDLNGPLDCSMQSDDPSLVTGISDAGICRTPAIQDDAPARTSATLRGRNLFDEVIKPF